MQGEVTSFEYLGTELELSRIQRNNWLNTISRIQARIASWWGKILSPVGRKTLIQSVTTAIPIYWLRHNIIPVKVTKQINGINSNFLWDGQSLATACTLLPGRR